MEQYLSTLVVIHQVFVEWIYFFIHVSLCTCLIIYWGLIPRVKDMHKIAWEGFNNLFSQQESMKCLLPDTLTNIIP